MNRLRYPMFVVTVAAVLILSVTRTAPVFADDGPPPTPTDVPVQVEPPAVEEISPDIEISSTESPTLITTAPSNTAVADFFASVPEGTDVVVTDSEGGNLPLGSTAAAQAVVTADPMWCPAGVAPSGAGCSINYTKLSDLVASVGSGFNPSANGTIWVSTVSPDASTSPILINGNTPGALTTWSNYSLTIKGGWTEVGSTIDALDPSELNVALSIVGWKADVTLSDIIITGVTGSSSIALNINTTKNITLTHVNVHDNAGSGTSLDNTGGTGNVTISNSQFNANQSSTIDTGGLIVNSKGSITLNSVSANGNALRAAYLDNSTASTPQPVTLTGTNTFSNNFYGLDIESRGAITLNNVTASFNPGGYGAYLRNNYPIITPQKVTLTGVNIFNNNFGGLAVYSAGVITINNVTANTNATNGGVYLNNTSGTADVFVVTGQFNSNTAFIGLKIYSNGAITLSNVTANSNLAGGVYLNNLNAAAKPVTLTTGTFNFNDNLNNGLEIASAGAINLKDITATGNDGIGANLYNTAAITAQPVTLLGTNVFSENNGIEGLYIGSHGAIKINNIIANANAGWGAFLNSCDWNGTSCNAVTHPSITITGINEFKYNGFEGLHLTPNGPVTLSNITANGNNGYGLFVEGTLSGSGSPQNFTLTGYGIFNNNSDSGLYLITYGAITLSNITANQNGGYGAYLNNYGNVFGFSSNAVTPKSVILTISGGNVDNTFQSNYSDGLVINTLGAISVSGVVAENTQNGSGATLKNDYAGAVGGITITGWGGGFSGNIGGYGLNATSLGSITISNLWAWEIPLMEPSCTITAGPDL